MTIRAIIVDDNRDVRELLTFLVVEAGAEGVDAVADGLTALAVLTTGPVDLVVTDYQMPGIDGIALARHVFIKPVAFGNPGTAGDEFTMVPYQGMGGVVATRTITMSPASSGWMALGWRNHLTSLVGGTRDWGDRPPRVRPHTRAVRKSRR